MACNVDCLSQYDCNGILSPQDGAIYSPFVQLRFGSDNRILTVGNHSAPDNNLAAIKSFEYGFSVGQTGLGFKIEVLDEGGTMYKQLVYAINKTVELALDDTKNCTCKFGWIITDCYGNVRIQSNEMYSGKLYFLPLKMQTSFDNGIVKFSFEGVSMTGRWAVTRLTQTLGSQDQPMSLKQALIKLFTEFAPKVSSVRFILADGRDVSQLSSSSLPASKTAFFKSSDGGGDGPKAYWPMDQQNALAVARKWLSSVKTINDKGILILYDPSDKSGGPSVIIKEDPVDKNCCVRNIGTFVVNGGNCSPVLSFSPDVEWNKIGTAAGGAATAGGASGDSKEKIKPTIPQIEKVGTQTGSTVQQNDWMWRMPDQMALKNADAMAAHIEANAKFSIKPGMEAELKLLGRPDLADTIDLVGATASIIVINPFYISSQNCSWLTTSNCNSILSNKNWMIRAVSHQINNGSYITTLKVMLPQPNDSFPAKDPLGGSCGGTDQFANSQALKVDGTS